MSWEFFDSYVKGLLHPEGMETAPDYPHVDLVEYGGRHSDRLKVDGHEVPYIEMTDWPIVFDGEASPELTEEFARQLDDKAPELAAAVRRGERIRNLLCDDRFGITAPESEIRRWAWFLANAMAVSAGYTSHGKGSRPINRHGPSRT
jgi:hypothetical protein